MITSRPFGALSDGTAVTCYRLSVPSGAYVDILDYGATVQSLVVPDRNGQLTDVILGYPDAIGYETGTFYFGATVGRHANRIGGGTFTLNGTAYQLDCNSGPNHSHGGFHGYHQRMFTPEVCGDALGDASCLSGRRSGLSRQSPADGAVYVYPGFGAEH